MDNKDLEKIIRENLQHNLAVPDDYSWSNMQSGILRPMEKPKRRGFLYLLFLLLGIMIVSFSYFYIYNKKPLTTSTTTSTIEAAIIKNSNSDHKPNSDSDSTLSQSMNDNNFDKINDENQRAETKETENKIGENFKAKSAQEEKANLTASTTSIIDEAIAKSSDYLETRNQGATGALDEKDVSDVIKNNLSVSQTLESINQIITSENYENEIISLDKLEKLPLLYSEISGYDRDIFSLNLKYDKIHNTSNKSKWAIGVSSGINALTYGANSDITGYNEALNNALTARVGNSSELNISYNLTDRLSVQGAIGHHIYRERIEFTQLDTTISIEQNVPTLIIFNEFSGNYSTVLGSREKRETKRRSIRYLNRYSVSEVSLSLAFNLFSNDHFDIVTLGGFGLTKRNSNGKYIDADLSILDLDESNFLDNKNISSNAIMGIRIDKDICSNVDINLGLIYRQAITNWSTNDEINIRPSSINLNIGFRLKI